MADRDIERILKSYGIDERDLPSPWHEIGITDPLEIKHWYDLGYRFWLNHSEEFPYNHDAVEHRFPHTAYAFDFFSVGGIYHADYNPDPIHVSPLPFALRRTLVAQGERFTV